MKREILFKAKRADNGEWVYGHLLSYRSIGKWGNCENYSYTAIMPDTVCQFTGLTDKNGNKIFEGDICRFESITVLDGKSLEVTIEFEDGSFWGWEESIIPNECEIIGNIYD
jgi:uncharacterized phage protein (TIGR01671 family)